MATKWCNLILERIKLKLPISKLSDCNEKLITHLRSIIRELGQKGKLNNILREDK